MKGSWPVVNVQWWAGLFLALVVLGACGGREQPVAAPLVVSESPEQGLAAYYYYGFYRHIAHMPSNESMVSKGTAGKPVPYVNHQFKGNIFDSTAPKGVGVLLSGYLKMAAPGKYRFQAVSNDGVKVTVNGQEVVFDPSVHSDRLSNIGSLVVEKPGWYPLTVKYYQRKGTARLELYWQTPGVDDFEIIPAAAYGHVPGTAR